jgi:LAO/AO transport system kinase
MTDFFLLLLIAGAGDELQGIKRGILEMVDAIAVNKADGDNLERAGRTRAEYAAALHLFAASADGWTPRVLTCSGRTGAGIQAIWDIVLQHRSQMEGTGFLTERRRAQALDWMRELVAIGLERQFREHARIAERLPLLEQAVLAGTTTSFAAARELLLLFSSSPSRDG